MPTCIHCGKTTERHLTMSLCPDQSGNKFTGNAGYVFSNPVGYEDLDNNPQPPNPRSDPK